MVERGPVGELVGKTGITHIPASKRLRTRLRSVVTLRRARGKQRQAGYSFG